MNRSSQRWGVANVCVPRTRGDEPRYTIEELKALKRSPHPRG